MASFASLRACILSVSRPSRLRSKTSRVTRPRFYRNEAKALPASPKCTNSRGKCASCNGSSVRQPWRTRFPATPFAIARSVRFPLFLTGFKSRVFRSIRTNLTKRATRRMLVTIFRDAYHAHMRHRWRYKVPLRDATESALLKGCCDASSCSPLNCLGQTFKPIYPTGGLCELLQFNQVYCQRIRPVADL